MHARMLEDGGIAHDGLVAAMTPLAGRDRKYGNVGA